MASITTPTSVTKQSVKPWFSLVIAGVLASLLAVAASVLFASLAHAQEMMSEARPKAQTATATYPTLSKLDFEDARHLLHRAGFGASVDEVKALVGLTPEAAAKRIVDAAAKSKMVVDPPKWTTEAFDSPVKYDRAAVEERQLYNRRQNDRVNELREWWLDQMVATETPLAERMTLFWHNHFATSHQKVRPTQWMWQQHTLLREQALGNFGSMLHGIAKDPAMLVYLDGANSRKQQPNENFAREVMELFTLGEGHYTEKDIKEAARAFTGWSVDRENGTTIFRRGQHDDGDKIVLGKRGKHNAEDAIKVLLQQPRTAEFITEKLWKEIVSPTPDKAEVKRLATVFRNADYELKPLLTAMLASPAFYAPQHRAALIKSPVDIVVGTVRSFGMKAERMTGGVGATNLLGQSLFQPPNVKGWPGGEAWVNSISLLNRKGFVERVFRGEDRFAMMVARLEESMSDDVMGAREKRSRRQMERGVEGWLFDADEWIKKVSSGSDAATQRKDAHKLLLAIAPVTAATNQASNIDWLRAIGTDPAYQLK
jgi:uncharacterized protein (DUF1800 family)